MGKLVVLNLLDGNFEQGFPAILEIGEDGHRSAIAIRGNLPAAPNIPESFRQWQQAFHNTVNPGSRSRIKSKKAIKSSCHDSSKELAAQFNNWLNSGGEWQKIRDKLQQELHKDEEIRVIIQTEDIRLRQLPWQAWDLFAESYKQAEIALSASEYESPKGQPHNKKRSKVRILAVLGNSDNINIDFDRQVLERLRKRGAKIEFLKQPTRKQLFERLWDEQGWHIFFFAGHSSSQPDGQIGWFEINQEENLAINELKNALETAIKRGLQLAIFNSCDGLGLANQLARLHLPHCIVMREPVPDSVAQEFLENFLTAFANNKSFYTSLREARHKLETWEKQYPGVSWLPIICQNPSVVPTAWQDWYKQPFHYFYTGFGLLLISCIVFQTTNVLTPTILDQEATVLDRPLCWGKSCIGRDPRDNKCDKEAVTITSSGIGEVVVELRHSRRCSATWARTTGTLLPRIDYLEDTQGKKYGVITITNNKLGYPTYYSDMGPGNIEIRACTQPQGHQPQCTSFVDPYL
jgi:CHAT domain/Protein of unknown function (DUF2690)